MFCDKGSGGLTPEEVTEALGAYGQRIARSTLTQYARIGVIGAPTVRRLGRGKGALSEYPPETPAEIVAARTLVGTTLPGEPQRITLVTIADVRRAAYTKTISEIVECDKEWFVQVLREWLGRRAWVLYGLPSPPRTMPCWGQDMKIPPVEMRFE